MVDGLVIAPLNRSKLLELVQSVDDGLEERFSQDRVMSNKLVDVSSKLGGILLLLESLVMTFGGKDSDDLGDDVRSRGELIETGLVEAEGSHGVGDGEVDLSDMSCCQFG